MPNVQCVKLVRWGANDYCIFSISHRWFPWKNRTEKLARHFVVQSAGISKCLCLTPLFLTQIIFIIIPVIYRFWCELSMIVHCWQQQKTECILQVPILSTGWRYSHLQVPFGPCTVGATEFFPCFHDWSSTGSWSLTGLSLVHADNVSPTMT